MNDDLEPRLRDALHGGSLPPAPASLLDALERVPDAPVRAPDQARGAGPSSVSLPPRPSWSWRAPWPSPVARPRSRPDGPDSCRYLAAGADGPGTPSAYTALAIARDRHRQGN